MNTVSLAGFDEPVSSLLHLGAALIALLIGARAVWNRRSDPARAIAFAVFVCSAALTLSFSGVYHLLDKSTVAADVLARLDHSSIFILIAGTATPAHYALLRGAARRISIALMWLVALVGVVLICTVLHEAAMPIKAALYIALGWLSAYPLIHAWRVRGYRFIRFALFGGLAYTTGAILLAINAPTLIPGVFGPHELWHIAVIAGLTFHWMFLAELSPAMKTARIRRRISRQSHGRPLIRRAT